MIIKEGSAEDIHRWFLTKKTDEKILCIFLCNSRNSIDVLVKMIKNAYQVDAEIGREIGFLIASSIPSGIVTQYVESYASKM